MFDADRYNYDYNRKEIEKKLKKLCSAARGTDVSILPFINDARGCFSVKKASSFINGMIRSSGLKGKEAGFYQAFLYCALRCYANENMYVYEMLDVFKGCSTFQDLLDKAGLADEDSRREWLDSKEKLMLWEYQELEDYRFDEDTKNSFFIAIDKLYEWLTGKSYRTLDEEGFSRFFDHSSLFEDYIRADQKWVDESIAALDETNEELAKENGYDSYEQFEKAAKEAGYGSPWDLIYENRQDSMTDEEWEEYEEQQKAEEEFQKNIEIHFEQNHAAWDRYREDFKDIDRFTEMYRTYRKLFYEVRHKNLYTTVESMIYSFMYDRKLSVCVNDEAMVEELTALDDIRAQLETAVRRSRKRHGL